MVYNANPFNFPLLILIWLTEFYLFLATCRLIMTRIPSTRQTHFFQQLKLLTDFIPEAVGRRLTKRKEQSGPTWLSWFIVLLSGFIIRQILIVIVTT